MACRPAGRRPPAPGMHQVGYSEASHAPLAATWGMRTWKSCRQGPRVPPMTASPTCSRGRRRCARCGTAAAKPRLLCRLSPATLRRVAQERKAWWPRLRDYMGKDIMSLMSVPVFIMVKPRRALARNAPAPKRLHRQPQSRPRVA